MFKGNNSRALAKCFFGVYTKFNIVCTACQHKNWDTLFICKCICLMRLNRKARAIIEDNEMGDHVVL